jgi:hypothetical protein
MQRRVEAPQILLLGATGFLGRRVARHLLELGQPFSASSLSLGTDLTDASQTAALFESVKPDFVLNCAAYVGGIQFGYKHQAEMFRNNLLIDKRSGRSSGNEGHAYSKSHRQLRVSRFRHPLQGRGVLGWSAA